jgi:pseudaminic acid biosynthesis-associated methylase
MRSKPMKAFRTKQEAFWAGEFGADYTARNRGPGLVASNLALFGRILQRTIAVRSVLELGANIGLNLRAIGQLLPQAALAAVEINAEAVAELRSLERVTVHHQSILEFDTPQAFDFVLVKGVLIHIHPDKLPDVYEIMYGACARYLCLAEYYSPSPVALPYRGHEERLFKRDFAGELLARYPDLRLIDYGFVYHGDPHFPQDDINWFLLAKTPGALD